MSRPAINGARGATLAALLCAILGQTAAGRARARCVPPPLELLWSYPADGATDVPTNAAFWNLSSGWSHPRAATLNGSEVSVSLVTFGASTIDPGMLAPDTDYQLVLHYGPTGAIESTAKQFAISFRTGAGPVDRLPPPVVGGMRSSLDKPAEEYCRDVLAAQDCFDTGQDTAFTFEVADDAALAWLVLDEYQGSSALWPVSCGEPSLYLFGGVNVGCKRVRALGPGGLLSVPTTYCPSPMLPTDDAGLAASDDDAGSAGAPGRGETDDPDAAGSPGRGSRDGSTEPMSDDAENGCRLASADTGWPWIATLVALVLRRRRAQTRR